MMKFNKEGDNTIMAAALIVTAVSGMVFWLLPQWLSAAIIVILLVLFGFVVYFFREPRRPKLTDPSFVFTPADGKVVVAGEEVSENEFFDGEKRLQVSIFMSIVSVHVNWFPVGGKVVYFRHHPGKYLVAWHPKSSELNERTTTVVDTGKTRILFRQIAGYVARRIVSYAQEGTEVEQNDKCGFIKFGSRVDIFLPLGTEILVKEGDKVTGSQTKIAKLK